MRNFLAKRREKKAEKKKEDEVQRRAQLLEKLRAETAESLCILRKIGDQSPQESRVLGTHEFHYNTRVYGIQVGYIRGRLRQAEVGSTFYFTLKDVGTSEEELHEIWLEAVRADVVVDAEEFGLIVTERSGVAK